MTTIERTPVASSNLASIGYDEAARTLSVEFRSGAIYHYFDVPWCVYEQLMKARSHGEYFCNTIREAYRYARVL